MMELLVHVLLAALALPAAAACVYLLLLTLLSAKLPAPAASRRRLRFDIIVPAHDEAPVIARTVASLLALDWPRGCARVRVIADNCTDATAFVARKAGADVIVRRDEQRRGKGHALQHAFERSLADGWAEALVVVDADTEVSPNLLEAFAARLERGAQAVQVRYGVLNPDASWRTRLMALAQACFHDLRSRGRERLGLSCGVRGNGWCVTVHALRECPYRAFTLAEDLEYGIALGRRGLRVRYAEEAHVLGEMVSGERAARSQRRRWEDGRTLLARRETLPLLAQALRDRSRVCLDLALDLLIPPLGYLAVLVVLVTALAAAAAPQWLGLALACIAALALYVLRGWQISGLGWRGAAALAHVPVYVAWKVALMLRPHDRGTWVRTQREGGR